MDQESDKSEQIEVFFIINFSRDWRAEQMAESRRRRCSARVNLEVEVRRGGDHEKLSRRHACDLVVKNWGQPCLLLSRQSIGQSKPNRSYANTHCSELLIEKSWRRSSQTGLHGLSQSRVLNCRHRVASTRPTIGPLGLLLNKLFTFTPQTLQQISYSPKLNLRRFRSVIGENLPIIRTFPII